MYENYDLCSLGIQTLQKYYGTPQQLLEENPP